ncbi:hypothetical protein J6590_094389 [Homalodisca vitripennis]|nr:hypothetical protein J6590_094389 [Homalodisca vitripennis]
MMTLQDHSDRMYTAVMEVGQHTHYGTLPTDHYTGTRPLLLYHSDRMYTAVMEVGQHTHYGTLTTDHYTGTRPLLLCL